MAHILAETDERVIANYIGWRVSQKTLSFLNKEAREVLNDYKKVASGRNAEEPRWKFCAVAVGFNTNAHE